MDQNKSLFEIPKFSTLSRILLSWKLLCIGFLAGGLIGAVICKLLPPIYRVSSVVVINQNLEKLFPDSPDREIFYFLERETNRLEELAFSDLVVQQVADQVPGFTIAQLRTSHLVLAHPSDGGWRMYGYAADPAQAKLLAVTWAKVFTTEVQRGVTIATHIAVLENQLKQAGTDSLSNAQVEKLTMELGELQKQSLGIHPEAQVYLSQQKGLVVEPVRSIAYYILAGALTGLMLVIILGAVFLREKV